jgi:hypothetical protein
VVAEPRGDLGRVLLTRAGHFEDVFGAGVGVVVDKPL